jgi:hypothetical protein
VGLEDVERFEELEERLLDVLCLLNYLEQLSNWVPHRGVPRQLGELYFWILDIHLHTPHTIEFFLAWHFFFFFFLCKQFFNIILLVQKKTQTFILLYMV